MTDISTILTPRRPYQDAGVDTLVEYKRAPLIAPMGSGKTRIALDAYNECYPNDTLFVVCPNNAIPTWQREAVKWLGFDPDNIAVAQGDMLKREWILKAFHDYQMVITNYASFIRDAKRGWFPKELPVVMTDESHRFRNKKSQGFKLLKTTTLRSKMVGMLTGTPWRRGPQDTWTMLHIANRKTFSSYWRYVNTWCTVIDGEFGKEIIGAKNTANFKKMLGKYAAYIPKEVVDPYLPDRHRVYIDVEPTPTQRKALDDLQQDMYTMLDNDHLLVAPNQMTVITRMRQMLVTPRIFDPVGDIGAGAQVIAERVQDLSHNHFVVFTPYAAGIPALKEYLERELGCIITTMRGGISGEEQTHAINTFKNQKCGMICSLQYAESFDLETCDTAFFLGYDWSPDPNEQAEDRLRRLTSKHAKATFYYIRHIGTIDEHVLELVNEKHMNVSRIRPKELLGILKN